MDPIPDTNPKPWEQQPDESPDRYAKFVAFRTQPANERAIRRAKAGKLKQNGAIYRLSKRFKWHERAAAYDEWMANQTAQKIQQKLLTSAEQYDKAGQLFAEKVTRLLSCESKSDLEKQREILGLLKLLVGKGGDIIGKVFDGQRALTGKSIAGAGKSVTLTFND
jgi:hypothetical protein